ncbi:hypothetical protein NVD72_004655 [Salmonella enterica]|uniref:Uncharacterized protein n=3 Tax=Epseptimavirus TaxID=2732017 RepID=A0A2Z5HTD4_9CAUD|nr:tail length tape measure protein [Salmonella phage Stitch]YP_009806112.1 tail length tape measure protein [Salmonella phage S124]EDA1230724.1 hypothetical protein [Salmonella enterica subsp. enterica serovar Derby]EDV2866318.1 hypothetical protein [Salmonella enterica subsp. enterica serovar Typhimurium]EHV4370629.1 hypothetical protein [Salmonella enterica]QCQ65431.1 hypothetical protein CPT_Seabear_144 [Salmonella phage Seabear]UUT40757.1 hypothetical protein [Salmonella phage GSP001]
MGNVVHLHRKTKIHRTSLSAANMITRKEGEESPKTTLAWKIVASNPNRPFNYNELSTSVDILFNQEIRQQLLDQADKLKW